MDCMFSLDVFSLGKQISLFYQPLVVILAARATTVLSNFVRAYRRSSPTAGRLTEASWLHLLYSEMTRQENQLVSSLTRGPRPLESM